MMARARPLLGTLVEIRCDGAAHSAVRHAFAAIETVQRLMSFHDPASELTQLNRHAHECAMVVHPWTWRVLRACRRVYDATAGVFDPSIALQLVNGGLLPAPSSHAIDAAACFGDVHFLSGRRIAYRKPLWLDLGGIAKGFAVDAAIATLRTHGVREAVVNAGGDLRVMGREPQPIWVRNPHAPTQLLLAGSLANGACASSGNYFHGRWTIVQPGRGAEPDDAGVTVLAANCMLADALTKVAALTMPRARERAVAALGGQFVALHDDTLRGLAA